MSRPAPDLAEQGVTIRRLARRCVWLSALNLALVTLCAARVYEFI